jgi:hypothetical protein
MVSRYACGSIGNRWRVLGDDDDACDYPFV